MGACLFKSKEEFEKTPLEIIEEQQLTLVLKIRQTDQHIINILDCLPLETLVRKKKEQNRRRRLQLERLCLLLKEVEALPSNLPISTDLAEQLVDAAIREY
jgi:hypothetical protein